MSNRFLAPAIEIGEDMIDEFARQQGWAVSKVIAAGENNPYEKIWLTTEGQGSLHYIQDNRTSVDYLTASGEQAKEMLDRVEQGLHMLSLQELRDAFDNAVTPNEALMAVVRAGVSAPAEVDQGYLELLMDGMHHESSDVRLLSVMSSAYPSWAELREPLNALLASENDEDVRELAKEVLESLSTSV